MVECYGGGELGDGILEGSGLVFGLAEEVFDVVDAVDGFVDIWV